jgi:hypothetical protein
LPSHRVHCYVDRKLFGKSYWRVHRAMDRPYLLFRRKHRNFFHDPLSAIAIAKRYYPKDPNAIKAALYHITLDNLCSANPAFKAWLEALAKEYAKKRASARKKKHSLTPAGYGAKAPTRTADPVKEFIRFLEKVKEFKALAEDF